MANVDPISLTRIQTLCPSIRFEVQTNLEQLANKNIIVRLIETKRTFEVQAAYYAQGRENLDVVNGLRALAKLPPISDPTKNIVITHSVPGLSFHQYGQAFDFCILLNGGKEITFDQHLDFNHDNFPDWMEVVNAFTAIGWVWGASFKDYDHLEKHCGGYNIVQLKTMHDQGKLDPNGYVTL